MTAASKVGRVLAPIASAVLFIALASLAGAVVGGVATAVFLAAVGLL